MRGRALLIATSRYSDPQLPALRSSAVDAEGLRQVLSDPKIGNFDVTACVDAPCQEWRQRIAAFFSEGSRDELLLLYVSSHGVKDKEGRLYFAATDTNVNLLLATGISSSFIHEAANSGRSQRVVMIFDACFSGAFAKGIQIKSAAQAVNVGEYFSESTGRVVLTASDSYQFALAGASTEHFTQPSLLSKHIMQGLRSGEADVDGDGEISTEDLLQYVVAQVRSETETQRPQRWAFGLSGDLIVASNPAPRASTLPKDVIILMESPLAEVRMLAVNKLESLLAGESRPLALAAQQALEQLRKDDSRVVSRAAAAVLQQPPGAETLFGSARRVEQDPQAGPAQEVGQAAAARQAEQLRQAAAARQAEQLRQVAAARQAEEQRHAAAARQAEEQRQAAAARQAEQERQSAAAYQAQQQRRAAATYQDQQQRQVFAPQEAERRWAMMAHLSALFLFWIPLCSFVGPLAIWRAHRRTSTFIEMHAKEALNFSISFALAELCMTYLVHATQNPLMAFIFFLVLLAWAFMAIVAAVRASKGINYRYPVTLRLVG
jgi:uncharacterized Tic20 family protein